MVFTDSLKRLINERVCNPAVAPLSLKSDSRILAIREGGGYVD
jgi:hypothetical protein